MLDFSLKVKESTRNGKQLKTLLLQNKLDPHIPLNNNCAVCNTDVDSKEIIECSICQEKFHIKCLTHPVSPDILAALSTNPCMWWFCGTCVKSAEATHQVQSTDESPKERSPTPTHDPSTQVDFINSFSIKFSEQLSVMKSEILSSVNDTIENKINSIANINNSNTEKEPDNVKLYSSFFSASSNPTADVLQPQQVPQPQLVPQPLQVLQPLSPEILVLSPKTDHVNSGSMQSVKKFVEGKLKTSPVEFIKCNENSKKVSIGFVNADARDKAAALINSDGKTLDSLGYQSSNFNKLLPKITIRGISTEILDHIDTTSADGDIAKIRDIEKEEIVLKIIEKNPHVKQLYEQHHTLSIVYLNKSTFGRDENEHEEITVGLKVSPSIYRVILTQQNASLYIGNHRYNVTDRFYIKQCYHCQMIGHTSGDCKELKGNQLPVYMYCAGRHRSANCPDKRNRDTHKCARCLASSNHLDAEDSKSHNAGSFDCPVLKRECMRIANNTDYMSKNVM